MCRNKGFFDRIEMGEIGVEGLVRLLGRDCGNVGTRGEEVILGVRYGFSGDFLL